MEARGGFRFALFDQMGQFGDAQFQRLLLLLKRRAQLFLSGERDFAFGQSRICGIPVQTQSFQSGAVFGHLLLQILFAAFQIAGLFRQGRAFPGAFLFVRGQALNFINDRVDFLVQHSL